MKRTSRQKRYPLCRTQGAHNRHEGRPFTCRACGKKACWSCVLHFWPERALPRSDGTGLGAAKRAIDMAEADDMLLGCCSRACRAKLPKSYAADFRLGVTKNRRTSRSPKRSSRSSHRGPRGLRRNSALRSRPTTHDAMMRHLDWIDPDAIGGHSWHLPGEDMAWSFERWKVKDLPSAPHRTGAKVRKYVAAIDAGSEPPAIVLAEGKPEYDSFTGELLRRPPMEVWDGAHRIAAAREAGLDEIDAYVGRHKES